VLLLHYERNLQERQEPQKGRGNTDFLAIVMFFRYDTADGRSLGIDGGSRRDVPARLRGRTKGLFRHDAQL